MTSSNSREDAIAQIRHYLGSGEFETELSRRVAFRTESQKADSQPQLHNYLDKEIGPAFEAMGFGWRKFDNPVIGGGPILLASRVEDPTLPTVLGYGHGDVIRGLEQQWSKGEGPWVIARDGDRIYGRGTADNKAQHTVNMAAMRCVLQQRGKLGFNAKFLVEMGEETGSPGLREIIESHKSDFSADVFIASDGPRAQPQRPTLTLGARGGINFDLVVNLREGAHHSGNWGGLISDPSIILGHALACIVGPKGEIKVPEWIPPEIPPSVQRSLQGLSVDAGQDGPKIDADWGQPGLTPAARVYASNSFAVLAMKSGNPDNPVNAIPPRARAHCQLRFVVGTDSEQILPGLRQHLDDHGFHDVEISLPDESNAAGFEASRTDPDNPWAKWLQDSMQRTSGDMPAVIPSMGGSICNDLFTDLLGLPALWIPHSYAGCSQHAPDEHILVSIMETALPIMVGVYWDLGEPGTPQND